MLKALKEKAVVQTKIHCPRDGAHRPLAQRCVKNQPLCSAAHSSMLHRPSELAISTYRTVCMSILYVSWLIHSCGRGPRLLNCVAPPPQLHMQQACSRAKRAGAEMLAMLKVDARTQI